MGSVFRLARSRHAQARDDILSGEGARRHGGRWNFKRVPMIYTSATLALAVLEVLVQSEDLPRDYVMIELHLPDSLPSEVLATEDLPVDWKAHPAPNSTQRIGSAWIRTSRSAALWVPSALVPSERNCLLNPGHPELVRVTATVSPFDFDPRLRPKKRTRS